VAPASLKTPDIQDAAKGLGRALDRRILSRAPVRRPSPARRPTSRRHNHSRSPSHDRNPSRAPAHDPTGPRRSSAPRTVRTSLKCSAPLSGRRIPISGELEDNREIRRQASPSGPAAPSDRTVPIVLRSIHARHVRNCHRCGRKCPARVNFPAEWQADRGCNALEVAPQTSPAQLRSRNPSLNPAWRLSQAVVPE
jgi:hypothetical protein